MPSIMRDSCTHFFLFPRGLFTHSLACLSLTFFMALTSLFSFCGKSLASLPIKADETAAVILQYQKIGEDTAPETSLKLSQFEAHIEEINQGGYHPMAFSDLLDAYQNGENLSPKSIIITFDGPYRSAYDKAFPLLIKHKIPFTIFISPELVGSSAPRTIGWARLQSLARFDFVEFGLHPSSYTRLANKSVEQITQSLKQARKLFQANMNRDFTNVFAYPFGEYTKEYMDAVREAGFDAATTLSSGVSYSGINMYQLPRFAMTERYGAVERFRMVTHAAPLPTNSWSPDSNVIHAHAPSQESTEKPDSLLHQETAINTISFQVDSSITSTDLVRCYVSGQDMPKITTDGNKNLVILNLEEALPQGRTRINCTMPGPSNDDILSEPVYRWYGTLYTVK